jgi:hypothetical protein
MAARTTQETIELLYNTEPAARVTQDTLEILAPNGYDYAGGQTAQGDFVY